MKRNFDLSTSDAPLRRFNTRRSAVRRWVKQLQVTDLGELGRRLHLALRQVNHQRTPTRHRLRFLEAILSLIADLLLQLRQQYADQPLPLGPSATRAAQFSAEVLNELLRGYRSILRSIIPGKEETSRWRTFWWRRELSTALHRFIHCGGRIIEVHRLLHMDPPEHVWRRIHRCYHMAEVLGLANARVRAFDAQGRTSPSEEYRGLLLSALLPADMIAGHRFGAAVKAFAPLLQLKHGSEKRAEIHYMVRLGRDLGPLPTADVEPHIFDSHKTRLMDVGTLCERLSERQIRGAREVARSEPDLDPAAVTLLQEYWCCSRQRSDTRIALDLPAEVAIGLVALVYVIGNIKPPPREEDGGIILDSSAGDSLLPAKQPDKDIWESIYETPAKAESSTPSFSPRRVSYRMITGRTVNRSEQGLAVVIERKDVHLAAVGMPAALRIEGGDWSVATIVRLKDRGEKIELGLRILLSGAIPARLRSSGGARATPFFDVVIGRAREQWAVTTPNLGALRSSEPLIELGGKVYTVQRGTNLTCSRYVEAFLIEPYDPTDFAAACEQSANSIHSHAKGPSVEDMQPGVASSPVAMEAHIGELMTETGLSRADAEFIISAEIEASRTAGG